MNKKRELLFSLIGRTEGLIGTLREGAYLEVHLGKGHYVELKSLRISANGLIPMLESLLHHGWSKLISDGFQLSSRANVHYLSIIYTSLDTFAKELLELHDALFPNKGGSILKALREDVLYVKDLLVSSFTK